MLGKHKATILTLLAKTRFFEIVSKITRRQLRILTYHRFGNNYITAQAFEKQIIYLKKNFNIIDTASCLDFFFNYKRLPPNPVLITVDDGYHDFYTVAFPILRKYEVPATVFLTVDFIDGNIWLWHDLLNYSLEHTTRTHFNLDGRLFEMTNQTDKAALKLCLDDICTTRGTAERDAFIGDVMHELRVTIPQRPTEPYSPLTWEQIREMTKSRINYGAHTRTHPILSRIPPKEAFQEINGSKRCIERMVQEEVIAFCYPNGTVDDFNEDNKQMVQRCRFLCAMSMIYGLNDENTDLYALKRMAVDSRPFAHFLQDVSGFEVLRRIFRKAPQV